MKAAEPGAGAGRDCEPCKNFTLVQDEAYPAKIRVNFTSLEST